MVGQRPVDGDNARNKCRAPDMKTHKKIRRRSGKQKESVGEKRNRSEPVEGDERWTVAFPTWAAPFPTLSNPAPHVTRDHNNIDTAMC